MKCSTVIIETESGPVVINKSDFDTNKHKLAGDKTEQFKKKKSKKG